MQKHQHQFFLGTSLPVLKSRRSHRKSRAGCWACKKGHIKCSEERPHCRKCLSRGKVCQYPVITSATASTKYEPFERQTPSLTSTTTLSAVSATFTLHDLKLFHHFLCYAYPPLPLGSRTVWTRDIPQLSHQSKPLMSALLALAASHINKYGGNDTDFCTALSHRGRAIAGLRQACTQTHPSAVEYDIMLAICYALTFQCGLLQTDSAEVTTFLRGCAMITERIERGDARTLFGNLSRSSITSSRQGAMPAQLDLDTYPEGSRFQVLLSKGIVSLCTLQTCIKPRYRGLRFLINLQSIFSALQVSPRAGYTRYVGYYAIWFEVAQDRQIFSSHSIDSELQLLWVFWFSLHILITLIIDDAWHARHKCSPRLGHPAAPRKIKRMLEWLCAIEGLAPVSLHKHFTWPRLIFDEAISHFDVPMISETGVRAKIAALCNCPSQSFQVFGEILELSASLANWTEDLVNDRSHERRPGAK